MAPQQWSAVLVNHLDNSYNHKPRTWFRSNNHNQSNIPSRKPLNSMDAPTPWNHQREQRQSNHQQRIPSKRPPYLMDLPTRNPYARAQPNQVRNPSFIQKRPTQQIQKEKPPPSYTPVNSNFTTLVKLLFRLVQVTHHLRIWEESIPLKINNQIQWLFEMIRLPNPSEGLKSSLEKCQLDTKNGILQCTKDHLLNSLKTTKEALSRTQCTNEGDMAARVAQEQLKRFGNKMTRDFIRKTLLEGLHTLGNNWEQEDDILQPTAPQTPAELVNILQEQEQRMEINDHGMVTTWITIDECHSPIIPVQASSLTLQIENEQEQEQSASNGISTLMQDSTHDPTQDLHTCRKRNRASSENSPHQPSNTIPKKYRTDTLPTDSNIDLNELDKQPSIPSSATPLPESEKLHVIATTEDRNTTVHTDNITAPPPSLTTAEITTDTNLSTENNTGNNNINTENNNIDIEAASLADKSLNDEDLSFVLEEISPHSPTSRVCNTNPQYQLLRPGPSNMSTLNLEFDTDFDTVLIGDSNLRGFRYCKLPSNWQVFGIAGLRLEHTANLFKRAKGQKPLNIILAIGINNREPNFQAYTATHIETMTQNLQKYFPSSRKILVGISARDLPRKIMDNIEMINNKLESIFGTNYVKPLPTSDITILQDRYRIHHNQVTTDRVLRSIISSLN